MANIPSPRRVVTGDIDGRSAILSDGPTTRLPMGRGRGIDELWINGIDEPLGHDPTPADAALTPPPGALHWRIFSVPPDSEIAAQRGPTPLGDNVTDDEGWHRTETLDYVYIIDGDITLQVDDGSVELHTGDCVVQRRTNHAWHNHSDRPVRIMAVMLGL